MVHGKNIIFIIIIFMVFPFISCNGSNKSAPNHHALVLMSHFGQAKKGTNRVIPFHVNMMALYLLEHKGIIPADMNIRDYNPSFDSIKDQCRNYIQWYLNHTTPSDQFRLTGTIPDFDVNPDGKEIPVNTNPRISRTAASFILLVNRFQLITNYKQMFTAAKLKIENIAYLLPHIQDPEDGLLPPHPKTTLKHLESNCVAYAGLDAFLNLSIRMGWGKEKFYTDARDSIKIAILSHLYRPKHESFYYLQEGKEKNLKKYAVDWKTFYPDSYAQLFPLFFKILPQEEIKNKRAIWLKIIHNHRSSMSGQKFFQRLIFQWASESLNQRWLSRPEESDEEKN